MAVRTLLTKQLAAASANNIALAQALGAAGNLTLNGALVSGGVATLDTSRRVLITSVGNDSGITFTLTGTNGSGTAITEVVTGGNATGVATLQDFATVSRIAGSAATAANVTVGTNGVGSTVWWVPNEHITPFEVAAGLELLSGSATATVECTDDGVLMPISIYAAGQTPTVPVPIPFGWPGMSAVALTINSPTAGLVNRVCRGIRLTINDGTGAVTLSLRQAGIRN